MSVNLSFVFDNLGAEDVVNPSYNVVKPGDVYLSLFSFATQYRSIVLSVEDISERFGKPDRGVAVRIVGWPRN